MAGIKAKELAQKNVAKAQQEAAKAAKDAAADQEKNKKAQERQEEQLRKLNDAYAAYVYSLGEADVAESKKYDDAYRQILKDLEEEKIRLEKEISAEPDKETKKEPQANEPPGSMVPAPQPGMAG